MPLKAQVEHKQSIIDNVLLRKLNFKLNGNPIDQIIGASNRSKPQKIDPVPLAEISRYFYGLPKSSRGTECSLHNIKAK